MLLHFIVSLFLCLPFRFLFSSLLFAPKKREEIPHLIKFCQTITIKIILEQKKKAKAKEKHKKQTKKFKWKRSSRWRTQQQQGFEMNKTTSEAQTERAIFIALLFYINNALILLQFYSIAN